MMNNQDDKLRALLKQWGDIEPQANFEANVRRRIRAEADRRAVGRPAWADWLRAWLPRPAWALAVAGAIGVVIGAGSGTWSVPAVRPAEQLGFLAPDTLAGRSLGR